MSSATILHTSVSRPDLGSEIHSARMRVLPTCPRRAPTKQLPKPNTSTGMHLPVVQCLARPSQQHRALPIPATGAGAAISALISALSSPWSIMGNNETAQVAGLPVPPPVSLASWNYPGAETMHQLVPFPPSLASEAISSIGASLSTYPTLIAITPSSSTPADMDSLMRESDAESCSDTDENLPGYRTADRVAVVRVPSVGDVGKWKVMVEKMCIYNTKEGGMDSFKYAASLNEWETWAKHHQKLALCSNLVKLHGFTKLNGVIRIYSEWCQGGDVQSLLSKRIAASSTVSTSAPVTSASIDLNVPVNTLIAFNANPLALHEGIEEQTLRRIGWDVLNGLKALHQSGLVYGDMKPSNVFIAGTEATPRYKIGDFGTMRDQGREHLHYFVSGFGFTPEYAAPETLDNGTSRSGPQSDLWSYGVMMHELATGHLPGVAVEFKRLHDGEFKDAKSLRRRFMRDHPSGEVMQASTAGLCPELCQVLRACLAESPSGRPIDATDLMAFPWFRDLSLAEDDIHNMSSSPSSTLPLVAVGGHADWPTATADQQGATGLIQAELPLPLHVVAATPATTQQPLPSVSPVPNMSPHSRMGCDIILESTTPPLSLLGTDSQCGWTERRRCDWSPVEEGWSRCWGGALERRL